ncbi:MAG: hypothetical protein M3R17_15665 [Bacteroidota bacterium]|nr:hypothetical protein [Bacteroidota bacterium]
MSLLKANPVSRLSLFAFIIISAIFVFVKMRQVKTVEPFIRDSYALSWDNYGYYLHLPAIIIHRDPGLQDTAWINKLNSTYQKDRPFYQVWAGQKNRMVNVYPVGFAVFNLPFFCAGHLYAKISDYPADGLSPPYQWSMIFSALFYGILGLWFLRTLLIRYFSDRLTAVLLLLIGLGTNLYYYATYECMLPHIYLFAADTLLILLTIKWHESAEKKTALAIGLLLGLITITRPSEIVWVLVPLFWNVSGWRSLKEKMGFLIQKWIHVFLLVAGMFAVGSLQLIYWKYTSGHWLSFNHTEGFDFFHPFTWKVLFSYKKGWLLYTPMMLVAISGFWDLYKRQKNLFLPLIIFFLANLWFISSWECWWYAGTFGQRPFVQSYGLMAIPLGYHLQSLLKQKKKSKYIAIGLIAFFLLLNQFQTWQYNHGIIHPELMTKKYYGNIFGKTSVKPEWNSLLEIDRGNLQPMDTLNGYAAHCILFLDYETRKNLRPDELIIDTIGFNSKQSTMLDETHPYGSFFKFPFDSLSDGDHVRIKMEMDVYNAAEVSDLNFTFSMTGKRGQTYGYAASRGFGTEVGKEGWSHVSGWFVTPVILHSDDLISLGIWNAGGKKVFLDNVKITVYEPLP